MAEVDLQGQQGELLANEKLVDPAALMQFSLRRPN